MLGNHKKVAEEIKKEMGEDTTVVHKFAIPMTIVSIVDGQKGRRECLPCYYNNCYNCGINPCGGHEKTAKLAASISPPAAPEAEMVVRD